MNHCVISLIYNEYIFIKHLLPYYYKYFSQIIFVDYDIKNNSNSTDGSIEFIKNFNDHQNKITLLTDYKNKKEEIKNYNGYSMIDKQKMFSYASQKINDDIDFVWGTDLDETFNSSLFAKVENEFKKDKDLVSIELMWKNFIFNQYNLINEYGNLKLFPSRICKHTKGKIYGHCNWKTYGKTKLIDDEYLYHFSFIGYKRCCLKLHLQNKLTTSKHLEKEWTDKYLKYLKENKKYVDLVHPGSLKPCIKYDGPLPTEFNVSKMIEEINLKNIN
jgi:hypothetical protein